MINYRERDDEKTLPQKEHVRICIHCYLDPQQQQQQQQQQQLKDFWP